LTLTFGLHFILFSLNFSISDVLDSLNVIVDVLNVSNARFINVFCKKSVWVSIEVLNLFNKNFSLSEQPRDNILMHCFFFKIISDETDVFQKDKGTRLDVSQVCFSYRS
jgi:hypothetical protein